MIRRFIQEENQEADQRENVLIDLLVYIPITRDNRSTLFYIPR